MSFRISAPLRSRSAASRGRRSGRQAASWRWPILAVLLGLFAPHEALAQNPLTNLELTDTDASPVSITLVPTFASAVRSFTASVPFGVTQVTVTPTADSAWTLTYPGATDASGIDGHQRNLTSGTNTITVRATKSGETTQNYTITVTRAAEVGSALSGLGVSTSAGSGTVGELAPTFAGNTDDRTFTADAPRGVTQVTVDADAKDGWTVTYHDEPDANTATDYQRNLTVGTNRITVRATPTGASGTRDYTITVTRTTTPTAPRNLRATSGAASVRLAWTAPSSNGGQFINNYEYRKKVKTAANYEEWVDIDRSSTAEAGKDDTTTSLDVGDLINGTTYVFQVRAENANGEGSASNTAEATPAAPLPAPVMLDPATTPGNRSVTLHWTRINDASVSGYQYRRRVGAGSWGGWTNIADRDLVVSDTSRSYTVTGLTNGTEYRFQVRGRNSVGGGAASTEVTDTPKAGKPGAPTNLSATAGDGQVTLSWSAPSDNGGEPITGYEYQYRPRTDTTNNTQWVATGGTGTTVTVRDEINNGTTYYFKVRAVNGLGCHATDTTKQAGCGQPSLEVSAKPFGKPETRVNLTSPLGSGDRRVTLNWTTTPDPPLSTDELSGFQYRQKAGGGYGSWIDVRNSDASTDDHVVTGLTNGTEYTFQVRAVNSSGGGLASNELSAIPSTTPGTPTLTATAGDKQVRLTWTGADDGGSRITKYECRMRTGAGVYATSCAGKSLGADATSLTLTDDDTPAIRNGTTYTFQVRAVNANGNGDWSNEDSARPTDSPGSERSFTISATIDGKSWAKADAGPYSLRATVKVNPRYTAQSTELWVDVSGSAVTETGRTVDFGPTNSTRDASFTVNPSAGDITIALLTDENDNLATALAVTSVEVRAANTPDPPTGLEARRGDDGEVTLSWATVAGAEDYEYRQRRQPGSYERWTNFAGDEFENHPVSPTVTSNTVTGLTDGGTYAFQVRAVDITSNVRSPSDPSDEVRVSLSGTAEPGGLTAPRNFTAAAGDRQVTLEWTAPAADGGAAISGYQYQQRAGAGAYGEWTAIPGGPSARSYIVTGLTNGTRYYFRVRAVNSGGPGPESTEETATPSLSVDTTLRALSLSPGRLDPAFTPATRIYAAAVGGGVAQVTVAATPNKAGARATITPRDANTTVAGHQVDLRVGANTIRVSVADGTNTGVYTITVTRAGSVPAAPTGLTATAGAGAVTLSWTAPTGAGAVGRYEYQQKTATGAYGAWTPIPGSGPSTTSHTVTGLTGGTAYVFRVRAVNSTGNGAASTEARATPAVERLVWAKTEKEVADAITAARNAGYGADRTFTAGETVEVRGSALFNAAEGVNVTFTAASDNAGAATAAASDGTVTVTARAAGMATITITARAPRPSGVTIVDQTDPREAGIRFDVEVGLEALTLELYGPDDWANLVEGGRAHANGTAGSVTVRARANRPVTEEVTVTLLPDRALSDAGATAADFQAEPIVIEAGETTGATVVTAVEDGTAEKVEELVLFGVAADNAGEVTGEVRLRLWDAAVPALPVIAQLLLAAFLAVGGYRRYRRR